jgi:hypothetical protein
VFNDETRSVFKRWQAARGYPVSGYLNKLQHKALLSEIVATTAPTASDDSQRAPRRASSAPPANSGNSAPAPHRSNGGDAAGAAFIGGVMGGMMGGMLRR